MVQCDKCNKQMTKNTLRYHHEKSCPGQPIDTQSLPVKRRKPKQEETNKEESIEAKLEVKKQPTFQDKLNEKILKRKESLGKLALQIEYINI